MHKVKINNQELLIRKQNDSNATSKCIDFQNTSENTLKYTEKEL